MGLQSTGFSMPWSLYSSIRGAVAGVAFISGVEELLTVEGCHSFAIIWPSFLHFRGGWSEIGAWPVAPPWRCGRQGKELDSTVAENGRQCIMYIDFVEF